MRGDGGRKPWVDFFQVFRQPIPVCCEDRQTDKVTLESPLAMMFADDEVVEETDTKVSHSG